MELLHSCYETCVRQAFPLMHLLHSASTLELYSRVTLLSQATRDESRISREICYSVMWCSKSLLNPTETQLWASKGPAVSKRSLAPVFPYPKLVAEWIWAMGLGVADCNIKLSRPRCSDYHAPGLQRIIEFTTCPEWRRHEPSAATTASEQDQ
jgi:hypothetical protein